MFVERSQCQAGDATASQDQRHARCLNFLFRRFDPRFYVKLRIETTKTSETDKKLEIKKPKPIN